MGELLQGLAGAWSMALPSLPTILLHLLLAFVLGQLLAWIYIATHRGPSYSRSLSQALILLSLIVTLVMLAIGDSLARAFGLFGALALIRFRTPVKDTRDTVFLFLAVGIGISVGTRNLLLAIVGTGLLLAIALYLHWTRFGESLRGDGVLRFRLPSPTGTDNPVQRLLGRYCRRFALMQVRESFAAGELEYAYQLELLDPELSPALVAELKAIPGAGDVSLLLQAEHEEP
jgi:hypothetical protein